MFTVTQHKVDKASGRLQPDFDGVFLGLLGFISDKLGLHKLFRWLQDEWLRYTTIRELDRLNDDYLDDIGIKKRSDILPIVKTLVKRRRERRHHPRCV